MWGSDTCRKPYKKCTKQRNKMKNHTMVIGKWPKSMSSVSDSLIVCIISDKALIISECFESVEIVMMIMMIILQNVLYNLHFT